MLVLLKTYDKEGVNKRCNMKIFRGTESTWLTKINFVDDNDVLIGFDWEQDYCEDFGYLINYDECYIENGPCLETIVNLTPYYFCQEFTPHEEDSEDGGSVTFKLIAKGKPDLFFHLYNHHNGYYSHGWTLKVNGKIANGGMV